MARFEEAGIVEIATGECGLTHPLFGELVRLTMSLARRQEVTVALAEAVEGRGRPEDGPSSDGPSTSSSA